MASSNHKVSIIVGVQDLASNTLRGVQNTINSMGTNLSRGSSYINSFNRGLDSTISKMDALANSMYKFNMYTSELQRNIKNIAMVGGLAAGAMAVNGLNNTMEFDYKTHTMQSRMMSSNKVRKEIEDYILKDLNLKVMYSPNQMADLGIVMGQAGVTDTKSMKKMLETTTYFSEAVGGIPDQMGEMLISSIKGWNLSMENSGDVADKLTIALNNSLLHVEELPHAIGQLAGRANLYGQSLDSSLVALMASRNQGLPSAQAAQNLLHGLSQGARAGNDEVLFARTKGYFDSLGINEGIFDKDTRKLKEFPELIADIENAMIKQGLTNNKYGIKTHEDFTNYVKKNGTLPDDIFDSMKAAPLLTKIFGKAGIAPILMGMQTKWEEVDRNTGEKTGEVYYGSEALKKMYNMVKNSNGATKETHAIIEDSAQFQKGVLTGAWQATQEHFFRNALPAIKVGTQELAKFLLPGGNKDTTRFGAQELEPYAQKSPFEKFREALDKTSENFKKDGHPIVADIVNKVGNGAINGIQISQAIPPMGKQLYESFDKNIAQQDWGNNLIEFPWHIVKNGISFIKDIVKSNKEFDDVVKTLPEDLQNPAKLMESLVKGGVVLLVTGAIVGVIEMGVRGVSLALKGAKLATSLTTTIIDFIMGKGGKGGKGGGLASALGQNMAIKANIVNVYGPTSGGGAGGRGPGGAVPVGGVGGGGGAPVPPVVPLTTKLAGAGKWFLKNGVPLALVGDLMSGAQGGPSLTKKFIQSDYNPLNSQSNKKIDEMHTILKNPSKYAGPKETELVPESNFFKPKKVENPATPAPVNYKELNKQMENLPGLKKMNETLDKVITKITPQDAKPLEKGEVINFMNSTRQTTFDINSSIISGFNSANDKLQNVKLNNAVSVIVQPPQVNVSGNIAEVAKVSSAGSSSFTMRESQNGTAWDRMQALQQRRLGW